MDSKQHIVMIHYDAAPQKSVLSIVFNNPPVTGSTVVLVRLQGTRESEKRSVRKRDRKQVRGLVNIECVTPFISDDNYLLQPLVVRVVRQSRLINARG